MALLSAIVVFVASTIASCADLNNASSPPAAWTNRHTIHVVGHGWHTGIVVSYSDLPEDLWPEKEHFSGSTYLEVGWGEEAFYRAQEITVPMVSGAALFPTRSVLHGVGFSDPVGVYFPNSRIVQLAVTESGFFDLVQYIHDEFVREEGRAAAPIGRGLYGNSYFFRARGMYSLFHNCNYWVAYGLSVAGVPMSPYFALTASAVLAQASRTPNAIAGKMASESP